MFNSRLITPRNIATIALFTVASHFLARPLYNRVNRREA